MSINADAPDSRDSITADTNPWIDSELAGEEILHRRRSLTTVGALCLVVASAVMYQAISRHLPTRAATALRLAVEVKSDTFLQLLLLLEAGPEIHPGRAYRELARSLVSTPVPVAVLHAGSPVMSVRFARDGRTVAAGLANGKARVWRSPSDFTEVTSGGTGLLSVSLSPNGDRLLTVASRRESAVAELWEMPGGRRLMALPGVSSVAALDGQTPITLAPIPGALRLVGPSKAGAGKGISCPVSSAKEGAPRAVRFSDSGDTAVALFSTWSLTTRPLCRAAMTTQGGLRLLEAALSSSGDFVATVTEREVTVWSVSPAEQVHETETDLVLDEGATTHLAVAPDGGAVAAGYADGHAVLADWQGGGAFADHVRVSNMQGHRASVADLAFSADGRFIATAGRDGVVLLWRNPERLVTPETADPPIGWNELWRILRSRTTVCLSAEDRTGLLEESPSVAARGSQDCEQQWGLRTIGALNLK